MAVRNESVRPFHLSRCGGCRNHHTDLTVVSTSSTAVF